MIFSLNFCMDRVPFLQQQQAFKLKAKWKMLINNSENNHSDAIQNMSFSKEKKLLGRGGVSFIVVIFLQQQRLI